MVFNTLTVGAAVTPSVIETYFSHYLNRGPLRQKPTAHISYHEGLRLIRQFLDYSSKHTVEDLQSFTGQWVPCPTWVRINDAEVAPKFLDRAAQLVLDQLGHKGCEMVGGRTWWQWRRPEQPLRAEWIEMKKEYHDRKRTGEKCERVILYIHGGAYYFGSVDEHRYQMQRHARKLRARVLSPRYRLAPQFPFPCALYDCLATYFYLLEHFDPTQIVFAGDSAGGGLVLSMLVVLRDQGQPLPAGTILISPWVDLTHSFPSVAGEGTGDYIPPHGFHHRPSMAWPPPPDDGSRSTKASGNYGAPRDAVELPASAGLDMKQRKKGRDGDESDDISALPQPKKNTVTALPVTAFGHPLSVLIDGKPTELKEQIQMYTTNEMLAHPLVSPVMQPSLGGLPPMLIQVGGAELLRDEQIYLAHKAAHPPQYPPNETIMREFDPDRKIVDKYPPTDVQLQLWEDLCHVTPTLSFTRPAKYMYRSIAQFGAWALSQAQQKGVEIQNDDAISIISSGDEETDDGKSMAESTSKDMDVEDEKDDLAKAESKLAAIGAIGKAGDPIPDFKDHMIRQRVTRHGILFPLAPVSETPCLALDPATIGVPKTGPVRKWLATRSSHDQRFANETKKVQKKRAKEAGAGYDNYPGEYPPPAALFNRRRNGVAPEEKKRGKSWGLAMWSGWGSSHDEHTLQREQNNEKTATEATRKQSLGNGLDVNGASSNNLLIPNGSDSKKQRRTSSASKFSSQMPWSLSRDRPRSPFAPTRDTGQAEQGSPAPSAVRSPITNDDASDILVSRPISMAANSPIPVDQAQTEQASVPTTGLISPDSEKIPGSENTFLSPTSSRPHNGFQAYPFKLREQHPNPSTATLDSLTPTRGGTSTPASGAHSELAGDVPAPVELPSSAAASAAPSAASTPASETPELTAVTESATEAEAGSPHAQAPHEHQPTSSVVEEASADIPVVEVPRVNAVDDTVHSMDSSKDAQPNGSSEAQKSSSNTNLPFKLRSTIFDSRTSMLGSIGPDGMPNAHPEFPVSTSSTDTPLRVSTDKVGEENTAPQTQQAAGAAKAEVMEPGKANEATKAAPFKLRHTVYDPNVTLAKSQLASDPQLPSQTQAQSASQSSRAGSSLERERERTSSSPDGVRSSVSSGDKPPSYDSMPLTHVILPEPVASSRPVPVPASFPATTEKVQEKLTVEKEKAAGYDDERPPTPPPKDDKPYNAKPTGKRKTAPQAKRTVKADAKVLGPAVSANGLKEYKSGGAAPMIGELGFEKGETEKRPALESFITASEGRLAKSS